MHQPLATGEIDRLKDERAPWWVHVAGFLVTVGLVILGFATWRQADYIERQRNHLEISRKTSEVVGKMQVESDRRIKELEEQVRALRRYIIEQARQQAQEDDPE